MNVLLIASVSVMVIYAVTFIILTSQKDPSPDSREYLQVISSRWQTGAEIRDRMEKLKGEVILMDKVLVALFYLSEQNLIERQKVKAQKYDGYITQYRMRPHSGSV